MSTDNAAVHIVHFDERPYFITKPDSSLEHAVVLDVEFSHTRYCNALFEKFMTIGLSDLDAFLRFNCAKVHEPLNWLNKAEKLVMLNADHFNTEKLRHRRTKLVSQFDILRVKLEVSDMKTTRTKDLKRSVNAFTDEKVYDFREVQDYSNQLETFSDKVEYLQDQVYEYQQNTPHFVNTTSKPFDELCRLEIEKLEKKEAFRLKSSGKSETSLPIDKLKINCPLNYLVDIFFRLARETETRGKQALEASDMQIAQMITNSFLDKNGKPISLKSVQTMLEQNRPEKRPKQGRGFQLD